MTRKNTENRGRLARSRPDRRSGTRFEFPFTLAGRTSVARHIAFAVILAAGAIGAFWYSAGESDRSASDRGEVVDLELLAVRTDMARTQLDELTLVLLEPFGAATRQDVLNASTARAASLDSGRLYLESVTQERGKHGDEAAQLLNVLNEWGPSESAATALQLYDGSSIAQYEAMPPPQRPRTEVDSIRELMFLDQAGSLTMHEVLIAHASISLPEMENELAEFLEEAIPWVIEDGGYLGPDPTQPLNEGWIPTEVAAVHQGDAIDAANAALMTTDLWIADQWVRNWEQNGVDNPPIALQELADQMWRATAEIRDVVDAEHAVVLNTARSQANATTARVSLFRLVGFVSAALALLMVSLAGLSMWRRSLELRRLVDVDPLTGSGNRNVLTTRTTAFLSAPRLHHHAVVMVDMDRFKVINDTHGHRVGDHLLQRLAEGLTEISASSLAPDATVVRLGGDEFVVSFHSPNPVDVRALETALHRLRSGFVTADDGEQIPLEFSFGIATDTGSPDLQDLLDASDLAVYEQKATRSDDRSPSRPQPAPAESPNDIKL